ncbi:aminopeptidase N [Ampullimonas aquatilis]|uniref:aminopeptidase N n=1 Tax=Ampullimonas aquatilis TaxID=1341549 RepID=UPI003C763256
MRTEQAVTIYRKDYQPFPFEITAVDLTFELDPAKTIVTNRMQLTRLLPAVSLKLDGHGLTLQSIRLNGLEHRAFNVTHLDQDDLLEIHALPEGQFALEIVTSCQPNSNTSLMGLYVSSGNFFTQCEAEGFRKITYYPDRPDVMSIFTVTLHANRIDYPVLLSNGNLVGQGDIAPDRHWAKWVDPFKKPAYLFALVAGKLVCLEKTIQQASGHQALLQVYVEHGNLDKTQHAMDSLVASIRWDQQRFGLELDLDRFMIVAVGDFNMGAMENKGLNIFNTKYVLANPATATDTDYANIESVVGHEYFHNWTGNRVTCRDWFQLSLKEGLTVFRDQEFSADMIGSESGRVVKRIEDVRVLRSAQFPEDAGPMAHPIRPDSYQEISNFYTVTVYEKGAEVVRMYQTLLGREGFRKGMDWYFARHDGQAVTCDDFLRAMADANDRDLTQFGRWYSQSGTPCVAVTDFYDAANQSYFLTLTQSCPTTPGQSFKLPFHIPVAMGLLGRDGKDFPLQLAGEAQAGSRTTRVLELTETSQTFEFVGLPYKPLPSLLRNFSAPVAIEHDYEAFELAYLFASDNDPFNRWEAGQRLALQLLLEMIADYQQGKALKLPNLFIEAYRTTLTDDSLDPAFREVALTLPAEAYIAEQLKEIDPQAVHAARQFVRRALAHELKAEWTQAYRNHQVKGPYSPDATSAAKRSLKNLALGYLCETSDASWLASANKQFEQADNMTDRFAALSALVNVAAPQAEVALDVFYAMFHTEALVVDKWFALQAGRRVSALDEPLLAKVRALMQHPDFSIKNPNRARSVISTFCHANPAAFHQADGSGYAFWVEQVLILDTINPQVAARLARSLDRWKKYIPSLRSAMQVALLKVNEASVLSKDTREVISKALDN